MFTLNSTLPVLYLLITINRNQKFQEFYSKILHFVLIC